MSIDYKLLKELGVSSLSGKLPAGAAPDKYSLADVDHSFAAELSEQFKGMTYHQFTKHAPDVMDLLQTVYSEVLPREVLSQYRDFANVMTIGNMDKATYKMTKGQDRGKKYVTRVGVGGRFETFRLDVAEFEVPTEIIGGGAILDWERLLAGKESLADYMAVLMAGFNDRINETIAGALQASVNALRPVNTKYVVSTFDTDLFKQALTTVRAYGDPVILATRAFIDTMPVNYAEVVTANGAYGRLSNTDVEDLRNTGTLARFYGAPIVELPQSFVDETNTQTVINDQFAYIVPGGDKKIATITFEGQMQFRQRENPNWSIELQAYQKLGVAIMHYNNWAIYQNTSL